MPGIEGVMDVIQVWKTEGAQNPHPVIDKTTAAVRYVGSVNDEG